jgi:DNA-binding XRE family transcriptional regulator
LSNERGRPVGTTEAELLDLPPDVRQWVLARLSRGWTQQQAADRGGVTQQWISLLESGRQRIGPITRARLEAIYAGDEATA